MPLLNESRSPRFCSWVGISRCWARIEASMGKPLNAVFAARTRTSAVVAWMKKNIGEPVPPKTAAASWAMTVSCGVVWQLPANPTRSHGSSATWTLATIDSAVIPANMKTAMAP